MEPIITGIIYIVIGIIFAKMIFKYGDKSEYNKSLLGSALLICIFVAAWPFWLVMIIAGAIIIWIIN